MKKLIFTLALSCIIVFGVLYANLYTSKYYKYKSVSTIELKDGDIIFQTSQSEQCKAVQIITRSKYSHCGILFKENGEYYVWEAVQPVIRTSLKSWIARGDNRHYVIKRLSNADSILSPVVIAKMKKIGNGFMGKNYDFTFEWSDDKIYCSELVWKIYKRSADVEVGKLEKMKDFDLSNPLVARIVKERYGDKVPMDETVISPASIFESGLLTTVKSE